MDWATGDYTRTYADSLFVPEPSYDRGVALLPRREGFVLPRREGFVLPQRESFAEPYQRRLHERRRHERFQGRVLRDAFSAGGGEGDAGRLVPSLAARPPKGGPSPASTYPCADTAHAEGFCGGPSSGPSPPPGLSQAEVTLQTVKIILLVVIVVLLAMGLVMAGKFTQDLSLLVACLRAGGPGGA